MSRPDDATKIDTWQLMRMRAALRLEIKGMRHSSGRSIFAHLKRTYGFKGTRDEVLTQLSKLIEERTSS